MIRLYDDNKIDLKEKPKIRLTFNVPQEIKPVQPIETPKVGFWDVIKGMPSAAVDLYKPLVEKVVQPFLTPTQNILQKGQEFVNALTEPSSMTEKIKAGVSLVIAGTSIPFTPFIAPFEAASKVPVLKDITGGIDEIFKCAGVAVNFFPDKFIDAIPNSVLEEKDRENVKSTFNEITNTAVQIWLGAKVIDGITKGIKITPEKITELKTEAIKVSETIKVPETKAPEMKPEEVRPIKLYPEAKPAIPKAKIYKIIKEEGIREVKGEPVKIVDGVDTFIHEGTGGWVVSESSTGRYLADSRTREGAIAKAKFEIDNVGEEKFKQLLSKYKLPQTAKPAIPKELELTKEARMVLDTAKKRITKPQIPETGVFKMPETAINENQIIKYANKIAELQGDNKISENHIFEALQYNDPVAEIKRFLGMKKQGYFPEYTLETSPSIQRMKEVIGNKEFSDFYTQATKGIGEVKPEITKTEITIPPKPIETTSTEQLTSRVFERIQAEHPQVEGELGYDPIKLKADAQKAVDLIATDKQKAYDIAMGKETSPDITSTAVNIAMSEKALGEGNIDLYSRLVRNRSLEQTRRGQEIVAERGSITDNSTSKYVKELIAARLEALGKKYLSGLKEIVKKTDKGKATDIINKEVAKVEEKIRTKKLDVKSALDLLELLTCL
jgi:hypothetical protein